MDGELCGERFWSRWLAIISHLRDSRRFLDNYSHGFASATALTAALLPILISLLSSLPPELGVNPVGMTILLAFSVSFGFILPINAPQNMVCMGTDTFTPRQFTVWTVPDGNRLPVVATVCRHRWKILGLM